MKLLLILRHKEHTRNTERWQLTEDGNVHVEFSCPTNSPSHGEHEMSPLQALRQFALMTSWNEGWQLANDSGWHEYVDNMDTVSDMVLRIPLDPEISWTENRNGYRPNITELSIHIRGDEVHIDCISKTGACLRGGITIDLAAWKTLRQLV